MTAETFAPLGDIPEESQRPLSYELEKIIQFKQDMLKRIEYMYSREGILEMAESYLSDPFVHQHYPFTEEEYNEQKSLITLYKQYPETELDGLLLSDLRSQTTVTMSAVLYRHYTGKYTISFGGPKLFESYNEALLEYLHRLQSLTLSLPNRPLKANL
jgi:hypothetical protein